MFETPNPPSIDPQTNFHNNSKFIRHKKSCPTAQHPQNPPKTFKFILKLQELENWVYNQETSGLLKETRERLKEIALQVHDALSPLQWTCLGVSCLINSLYELNMSYRQKMLS